tara:strand:- start:38 stop:910 length:873 start_codon:yes stop_codon:yes gene_type:complete
MKKFLEIVFFVSFFTSIASADIGNTVSKKISDFISNLIPGEGITETSIEINDADNDNINFSILAVRNLDKTDDTNFFTQFSLKNEEKNSSGRLTGNLGFGYRSLNEDKSFMHGANVFLDGDIFEGHKRLGLGWETKSSLVDLSTNYYQKLTRMKAVDGTEEKILSGWDYNLTTQVPYHPWINLNLQGYNWYAEKASVDTKGMVYTSEFNISPVTQFNFSLDNSGNEGVEDIYKAEILFTYPPRENIRTMQDGKSNVAFEKENMQAKLTEKVRRNNNLTVEIQGAVIVTSK